MPLPAALSLGYTRPEMIPYDVLTRAIADWSAGVRPTHGSGPHHSPAAAPIYDYAAESPVVAQTEATEAVEAARDEAQGNGQATSSYDSGEASPEAPAEAVPEQSAHSESGVVEIEDAPSGVVQEDEG